jgi:hypothetical protein
MRKSVTERLGRKELISEAELFDMAERPAETGVDLNEVVSAIEAELEAQK